MRTGRTRPLKIRCILESAPDLSMDVVVKLSGTWKIGKSGFATEVFVSHLARIVGIPCPQPVILSIPKGFTVAGDDSEVLQRSHGLNFASVYVPEATTWLNRENMAGDLIAQAANILVFDALIQNRDRLVTNPNLLFDGKHIIVIDHEQCLGVLEETTQLDWIERHVLLPCIRSMKPSLERAFHVLDPLDFETLDSIRKEIPDEWVTQDIETMIHYIKRLLRNTAGLRSALLNRVFR